MINTVRSGDSVYIAVQTHVGSGATWIHGIFTKEGLAERRLAAAKKEREEKDKALLGNALEYTWKVREYFLDPSI